MAVRVQRSRGFTLVELVIVIILMGIIAGVLAPVISQNLRAYSQTQARTDLTAKGRIAIERLARELRNSIPGSVEVVSATAIEFITAKVGGRYVEKGFSMLSNTDCPQSKRFDPGTTRSELCLLHTNEAASPPFALGDVLVIGSQDPSEIRSAVTTAILTSVPASADCLAPNCPPLWPPVGFAAKSFPNASSGKHYAIADYSHELRLIGSSLYWRRSNGLDLGLYDNSAELTSADPLLIDGISSLSFAETANGILLITLTLSEDGESVTLYHEVYIRNAA